MNVNYCARAYPHKDNRPQIMNPRPTVTYINVPRT